MIQQKIDDHLSDNKESLCSLYSDIERLSLDWKKNGYHWDLVGHIVPKYMPWKDERVEYRTALSPEKFFNIKQLLASAPDGVCVEFGVFTGGVTRYMLDQGRQVMAFDTFTGIAGSGEEDIHQDGDYNGGDVMEYINGAEIVKGIVPDSLNRVDVGGIAFAHIDMDVYEPTVHALKWAYSRLKKGGIIVLDDYGNATTPGIKKAVDEFNPPHKMFLPNSQMIIWKL